MMTELASAVLKHLRGEVNPDRLVETGPYEWGYSITDLVLLLGVDAKQIKNAVRCLRRHGVKVCIGRTGSEPVTYTLLAGGVLNAIEEFEP